MRLRTSLFALALLAPAAARADQVVGTRSALLVEREHAIEAKIGRGHATLIVHRTFENGGAKHDQAVVDILDMPAGAVATGLRTMGMQDGKPVWFAGELLEAELAAKRYKELTGIGGYYPKDPALLSWRSAEHLKLQVFPIDPKGGKKTVEYTLEVPMKWGGGTWNLELPQMGTDALAATVTLKTEVAGDGLALDDVPVSPGAARRLSAGLSVALAPKEAKTLEGSFASVGIVKNRALLHASLQAAPRVSELPIGAYVVVAVDGSRSVTEGERKAQVEAIAAYLAHLPDAHVQLLEFDRAVRAIEPTWVTAKQAIADLRAHPWKPRNGSALDLALAEAKKRILDAPTDAPRRILVTTDLLTAASIGPSSIAELASTKAILHVARVSSGAPSLTRDDGDEWAAVPRATGGVLWRATARDQANEKAKLARTFEEWARPLRIDRLTISGVGLPDGLDAPDSLPEGEGFEDLRLASFPTPAIEVKGELWSSPVKTVIATNASEEKRWAALAFGSDVIVGMKDSEMMTLAMKGGAVSPVTSYLAIEPGVRPSTEGLEEGEGGFGLAGMGFGSGGCGIGSSYASSFDRHAWLRSQLGPAIAACGASARTVRIRIESTRDEVVAASATLKGAPDAAISHCLAEAAWALELPAGFKTTHAKYEVAFGD